MKIFSLISNWPAIQKKKKCNHLKYTDKIETDAGKWHKVKLKVGSGKMVTIKRIVSKQRRITLAQIYTDKMSRSSSSRSSRSSHTSSEMRETVLKPTLLSLLSNCFFMPCLLIPNYFAIHGELNKRSVCALTIVRTARVPKLQKNLINNSK